MLMPALHLEKHLEVVMNSASMPRATLEEPTAAENLIAGYWFRETDMARAAYSRRH